MTLFAHSSARTKVILFVALLTLVFLLLPMVTLLPAVPTTIDHQPQARLQNEVAADLSGSQPMEIALVNWGSSIKTRASIMP